MYKSFNEIEKYLLESGIKKKVVLCGAHDEAALSAVVDAYKKGVIDVLLIGDKVKLKKLLNLYQVNINEFEIIDEPDENVSAPLAIKMVKDGEADIPMKGLMQSSTYIKAVLNKETGILAPGRTLTEVTAFEYPEKNRIIFATDCAINVNPDLSTKEYIVKNAVDVAKAFGYKTVKVAALSAVEKVNPKLQSSVDAEALTHMEIKNAIIEGPYALDNALSIEAAKNKGIVGKVAGDADILLASDLNMGNVLHKSIHFFGHYKSAGAMAGTDYPIIFTSRTDSPETKYYSILTAILQSISV